MIIQCESCSRKFVVNDRDIPETGRMVQCGYCSVTWHQMPVTVSTQTFKQTNIIRPVEEINEELNELRENTYKRIKKIVWSSYEGLEEQQQIAIIDLLKQRIHTLADVNLITRLDKMTR